MYHRVFMNEWKYNMDNTEYKRNLERCVALPDEISVINRCSDKNYWLQKTCKELICFDFQEVILHIEYKMKDPQPDLHEYLLNGFYIFS